MLGGQSGRLASAVRRHACHGVVTSILKHVQEVHVGVGGSSLEAVGGGRATELFSADDALLLQDGGKGRLSFLIDIVTAISLPSSGLCSPLYPKVRT
jgi:hypothetical protein